jgi:hypothetical protein
VRVFTAHKADSLDAEGNDKVDPDGRGDESLQYLVPFDLLGLDASIVVPQPLDGPEAFLRGQELGCCRVVLETPARLVSRAQGRHRNGLESAY